MRTAPITGVCLLMLAMSCCMGHPAPLTPVSDLVIERLNNNYLPLDSCSRSDDGKTVTYRFFAKDCLCSSGVLIICQHPENWAVTVNGSSVLPHDRLHLHGDTDGCYFVEDRLQAGENAVEFRRTSDAPELPCAFLAGDFSVEPVSGGNWNLMPAKMLELGSWSEQGLPFYTWEVSYSRSFEVPAKTGKRVLRLGRWKGSECEVWMDGDLVGTVLPGTEQLGVGPFRTPGESIVEIRCTSDGQDGCGLYEEFTIE